VKRLAIVAASIAVTALLVYLSLLLGAWGFDTRRYAQHTTRLEHLLALHPRLEQVVAAFQAEGTRLVASADDPEALTRLARERGGPSAGEVLEKGARWSRTRLFLAGDMYYFIYFDDGGVMRGFTCVSR
jgi:hypothetical protein